MLRRLKQGADALGAGLFAALFVVFIVQIVARFGFNKPLPWTDEAAVCLYVWVILWAAAAIVPEREHVVFALGIEQRSSVFAVHEQEAALDLKLHVHRLQATLAFERQPGARGQHQPDL